MVEKTDRIYRNLKDRVTLDELEVEPTNAWIYDHRASVTLDCVPSFN